MGVETFTLFPPLILLLNSLYLFFFQIYFSPKGALYASLASFLLFLLSLIFLMSRLYLNADIYICDFGRWFFCVNFFDSHITFIADFLSLVGGFLVGVLTPLALIFGSEYMYREFHIYRLLLLLNFFAVSVVCFFFVYDFFLLLLTWEGIGLFSLLLVNFYSIRVYTLKAALKTFILSRISDMFLFSAFTATTYFFQTTDFSLIFLQLPFFSFHYIFFIATAVHFLSLLGGMLAMGGLIKSAQFFFHVWLPDAMEAPTPASALIHSSTLVIAGIFLILRFSLLFEFTPTVNNVIALYGTLTLLFASMTACFQQDLKKLVAYSTISQIGYLVCGCGILALNETLLYLIVHALNKALLFILVGYLVHWFRGNTDLRFMGGVWIILFDYAILLLSLGGNLAGVPYFGGFLSKELLLYQSFWGGVWGGTLMRSAWLLSFFFTPFYMFLPLRLVIFSSRRHTSTLITSGSEVISPHTWLKKLGFQTLHGTGSLTLYLYAGILALIMAWGDFFLLYLTTFFPMGAWEGNRIWGHYTPTILDPSIMTATISYHLTRGVFLALLSLSLNFQWRFSTYFHFFFLSGLFLLV